MQRANGDIERSMYKYIFVYTFMHLSLSHSGRLLQNLRCDGHLGVPAGERHRNVASVTLLYDRRGQHQEPTFFAELGLDCVRIDLSGPHQIERVRAVLALDLHLHVMCR